MLGLRVCGFWILGARTTYFSPEFYLVFLSPYFHTCFYALPSSGDVDFVGRFRAILSGRVGLPSPTHILSLRAEDEIPAGYFGLM